MSFIVVTYQWNTCQNGYQCNREHVSNSFLCVCRCSIMRSPTLREERPVASTRWRTQTILSSKSIPGVLILHLEFFYWNWSVLGSALLKILFSTRSLHTNQVPWSIVRWYWIAKPVWVMGQMRAFDVYCDTCRAVPHCVSIILLLTGYTGFMARGISVWNLCH